MCDTMVRVTNDGVLFAKNSDRDPNESQLLEWHPAAEHGSGRLRVTHADLDQVPRTHGILISRPWWLWGAEMGTNEHGVTIGNEAVFTRGTPAAGGLLTGMDLLRLALERSTTRADAVQVLVTLLEEHGQAGSASHEHPSFRYDNSFLVADRDGAIVLETAGRSWATEDVSGARSISNGLTIPGFAEKHADRLRGAVAQCATRRSRTTRSASRVEGVLDLMAALRDHGAGPNPTYRLANGALAAPCAHAGGLLTSTQSTASWVSDLRDHGRHWVTATSAPCTSIFKPVDVGPVPRPEPAGATNRQDAAHLWWRHERVHRSWVRNPEAYAAVAGRRDELECRWVTDSTDPEEAWAEAENWEREATAVAVTGAPRADSRPLAVRALWRRWNRQAGVGA